MPGPKMPCFQAPGIPSLLSTQLSSAGKQSSLIPIHAQILLFLTQRRQRSIQLLAARAPFCMRLAHHWVTACSRGTEETERVPLQNTLKPSCIGGMLF